MRPGYAGKEDFFIYRNQFGETKIKRPGKNIITLDELSKLDIPFSKSTLENIFLSKDSSPNLKKLFKKYNIKSLKIRGPKREHLFKIPDKKQLDGLWGDTIKLVESGKTTVPSKMLNPFREEVLKVFDQLSKENVPFSTTDIYYKVVENVQDNPRIFLPPKKQETKYQEK